MRGKKHKLLCFRKPIDWHYLSANEILAFVVSSFPEKNKRTFRKRNHILQTDLLVVLFNSQSPNHWKVLSLHQYAWWKLKVSIRRLHKIEVEKYIFFSWPVHCKLSFWKSGVGYSNNLSFIISHHVLVKCFDL